MGSLKALDFIALVVKYELTGDGNIRKGRISGVEGAVSFCFLLVDLVFTGNRIRTLDKLILILYLQRSKLSFLKGVLE